MLRYKIFHRTYYGFSSYVSLGPHTLRLRPREGHELRIESSALSITPTANLMWHRDVEGNSVATASFDLVANELSIESEVIIQQFDENPLNFLVADYAIQYPFQYLQDDQVLLTPYLVLPDPATGILLAEWIARFWRPGEPIQTYQLLQRLCTGIHQTLAYRVREEPGVQTVEQTLGSGSGSCRDFAWLFMQAARCLGLASRFVSGYLYAPNLSDQIGSTHAWAEVYMPEAGWKGFDPTVGGIAGADHIAVAVARKPESIPPVAGTFTGVGGSSLTVGVWVSKLADG